MAYELVTGKQVFTSKTAIEICLEHISKPPEPPSALLSAPLPEKLILELLAKDPSDRPRSALALRERLAECKAFGSWTQRHAAAWWEAHEVELRDKHP